MKRGFTLVEIMIVVAIIALLAAIAIPNLLRARLNANEAAAIGAMKTIATAAISYRTNYSAYPSNLGVLDDTTPPYIDSVLAGGTKQGYTFVLTGSTDSFIAVGRPSIYGKTGVRSFRVDESGVIRYTTANAAPAENDNPIE